MYCIYRYIVCWSPFTVHVPRYVGSRALHAEGGHQEFLITPCNWSSGVARMNRGYWKMQNRINTRCACAECFVCTTSYTHTFMHCYNHNTLKWILFIASVHSKEKTYEAIITYSYSMCMHDFLQLGCHAYSNLKG